MESKNDHETLYNTLKVTTIRFNTSTVNELTFTKIILDKIVTLESELI